MNTKLFCIDDNDAKESKQIFREAAGALRAGGLVVFPTETVYGLGADATDAAAAARIYAAKGRPSDNPLIVHIAAPEDAEKYAYTGKTYEKLADLFMPGPLTVIMPVKPTIPREVTAGLPTVAVRCPAHPVAQRLLAEAGIPIAAPSANLSGSPSPTCAKHVIEDMQGRVDVILDGGDAEIGVESTIVKIEEDGSLTLLRPGAITPEMLCTVTENVHIADAVLGELQAGEVALSPGMKYKHYAPQSPLFLLDGPREKASAFVQSKEDCALLCYEEDLSYFMQYFKAEQCFSLGKAQDTREQAHRLFSLLREVDKLNFKEIYAPLPAPSGMGMALYNRMIRAAAHNIIRL